MKAKVDLYLNDLILLKHYVFPQSLLANIGTLILNRPLLFPSISSTIILSLNAVYLT
jgi:hypothetical protein